MMVLHPEDEYAIDMANAFLQVPAIGNYTNASLTERFIDNFTFFGVRKTLTMQDVESNKCSGKEMVGGLNGIFMTSHANEEASMLAFCKQLKLTYKAGSTTWATINTALNKLSAKKKTAALQKIAATGLYKGMSLTAEEIEANAHAIEAILNENKCAQTIVANGANKNAFILVNDLTYVTFEERQKEASTSGKILSAIVGAIGSADSAAIANLGSLAGLDLRNHAYLFQLVGEDESTYRMKFVAHTHETDRKATNDILNKEEYLKYLCARSLDKTVAELQEQCNAFKTFAAIEEVSKEKNKTYFKAKIGLKEGIHAKSKLYVVKTAVDAKTNATTYHYVATLKPVSTRIWDNRYLPSEADATNDTSAHELEATCFTQVAGGAITPGMLIINGPSPLVQGLPKE